MKRSFAVLSVFASSVALGWNGPGHMAVAGLAYDELSPKQQKKLVAAIKKLSDLQPIKDGFPTSKIANRDLVMAAATWPDLIKQLNKNMHKGIYEDNQKTEKLPDIATIDYSVKMHKKWHYIDIPFWVGANPQPLPDVPEVNALKVVDSLVGFLGQQEPAEQKAYQIVWLMHLVGDLHQPLHTAEGCSTFLPKGDGGGNSVEIVKAQGETIPEASGESELHAFWDDVLGKRASGLHLDKDAATANAIKRAAVAIGLPSNADDLTPQTWVGESHQLAVDQAYGLLTDMGVQTVTKKIKGVTKQVQVMRATIHKTYADKARETALNQVRLAGHRLGQLLAKAVDNM